MKILWCACTLVLPPAVTGQLTAAPELPDSSYLALTLELPIQGTFQVTRFELVRSGSRPGGMVFFHVQNVEVQGCTLSLLTDMRLQQDFRASGPNRWEARIPLRAIDLESIQGRIAQSTMWDGGTGRSSRAPARYEPSYYEVVGKAVDRRARPIIFRHVQTGRLARDWQFSIPVRDSDAAARFSTTLIDAAKRCDVWRTAPLLVIR
jgi:hypothetical protein